MKLAQSTTFCNTQAPIDKISKLLANICYYSLQGTTISWSDMSLQARVLLLYGCIAVLTTEVTTSCLSAQTASVLRHHYGVLFRLTQAVIPVTGYWLHTSGFTLPLRPRTNESRTLDCSGPHMHAFNATSLNCMTAKPFVEALANVQNHMSRMLVDTLHNIERLVPITRRPSSTRTRHTRSWIPFLGNVLKTVTGTATQDDIRRVSKSVDDMRRSVYLPPTSLSFFIRISFTPTDT